MSTWGVGYPAMEAAGAAGEASAWEAVVIRPGRSETNTVVRVANPAMTRRSVVKPAAFTVGPSRYTASELTPNDTASRVPATRERIRSSTYCTMSASMNGMAPKTSTMMPRSRA